MKNIGILMGFAPGTIILPSQVMASEAYSAPSTQAGYDQVLTVKSEQSAPTLEKQSPQQAKAGLKDKPANRRLVREATTRTNNMLLDQ